MLRRAFLLVAPALVAGCSAWPFGGKPASVASGPPDPMRAECESHVYDDPKVHEQIAKSSSQAGFDPPEAVQAVNAAKRDAVQRCLSRHGHVGLGGGVELPR